MILSREKKKDRQIDMLHGSLFDKILKFAVPLALTSILQQLFNSVDIAVLGRFESSQGQAAVGCVGPVINMVLNLFIGISVGANVVIARYIGENKKGKIKDTVHTAILMAIIIGIFLMITGILFSGYILRWMNTPEDVLNNAILYLKIYFLGAPFIMIYNFGSSILRSIGDTKRPLYSLFIAGIINTIINLVLVISFNMGVLGVAIGTVVSNIVCACMVMYFLSHEDDCIKVTVKELKITSLQLKKILKIGLPAGLQAVVFSIANVFIQTSLNGYGSHAVAGSAITLNYEYYMYFIVVAFTQATVTFTSQNFGAKQYDRCKRIFRQTFIITVLVSFILGFGFIFGRNLLIYLFTSESETARYAAIRMVHLFSFYTLVSIYEVSGGALRGIGYSMTPAIITIFGTCVLRIVWISTISKWYGSFETLMNVYPVSWSVTAVGILSSYIIIRKKVFNKVTIN